MLLLPLGVLTLVVLVMAWGGSAALLALPLYVGSLPGGTAKFWLFEVGPGAGAVGARRGRCARAGPGRPLGHGRARPARRRRGPLAARPRQGGDLEARVTQLETSRTAAVDSAEAERRRIERDLHDGAQQRLVALAIEPGRGPRAHWTTDPDGGRALVDEAHEEAKAALKELRDLVRGIHPVILEDRGLDAALSAVVARSPVPVALDVQVAERPPAAVESAAYFVVAEALTNVARHAEATRACGRHRPARRPAAASRSATTASAAPTRSAGTGLRGPARPGRRPWAAGCTSSARRAGRRPSPWSCRADRDRRGLRPPARRAHPPARRRRRGGRGGGRRRRRAAARRRAHQPDLAVVDVRMPPTHTDDGLRAALEIRRRWPHGRHPRAVAVRRGALRHRAARRRHRRASATC